MENAVLITLNCVQFFQTMSFRVNEAQTLMFPLDAKIRKFLVFI